MLRHLEKVLAITQKYGLEPMIWSDMFFRLGSKTGDYYDLKANSRGHNRKNPKSSLRLLGLLPQRRSLLQRMDQRHRSLGSEPIFAGGIWTWAGMCLNYGKTFVNTNSALTACKKRVLKMYLQPSGAMMEEKTTITRRFWACSCLQSTATAASLLRESLKNGSSSAPKGLLKHSLISNTSMKRLAQAQITSTLITHPSISSGRICFWDCSMPI